MPELPEVEIVKQSLKRAINHKKIRKVIVKNRNLRFKLPVNFSGAVLIKAFSNGAMSQKSILTSSAVALGALSSVSFENPSTEINSTNTVSNLAR